MESLLRLSGLLGGDDGATDLGTLEKRLAEKARESRQASQAASNPSSPSQTPSGNESTPRSSITSPEPGRDRDFSSSVSGANGTNGGDSSKRSSSSGEKKNGKKEEEVEALSEMMCSLVTNNEGDTRYIGAYTTLASVRGVLLSANKQAPRLASPSSRPRACSGSMRRRVTTPSSR